MKYGKRRKFYVVSWSLPARGARVEIIALPPWKWVLKSLPARGARVEISFSSRVQLGHMLSLPARGARVEIVQAFIKSNFVTVAPREGSEG